MEKGLQGQMDESENSLNGDYMKTGATKKGGMKNEPIFNRA